MNIFPPWFCVGGRILLLLFWVKGHLARWCQMTLKQSSSCIKGFQCLSFYDFSVRIWGGQTKTIIVRRRGLFRQQKNTKQGWNESYFCRLQPDVISAGRSGAIFESGVKGNFAKGPAGNSLEKSGQLVLVYQHLPEPAEKLTFQKIANYPRYF